jgi:DNA-binding LacI/PurR family transcriptional regulator
VANPDVTAVFCANDDMAIGLMRALDEVGRPVPEAVSVIGFDDIPAAAYLKPPLTTVRQVEDLATRAIEILLQLLPGAASGEPGDEPTREPDRRLIIRASTAPPPLTQRNDAR